jgi:uncharacterized phage protein (predicted DNA packaging)
MSITVEDLKAHLNIDHDLDDALLQSKIEVATEWVGAYSGAEVDTNSPAPLREAVRMLAGHLYENREATLVGVTAQSLPFGVMDLINPYRAWSF